MSATPLPEFDGLFAALPTGFNTGPPPGAPDGVRAVFSSFPPPPGPDATKVDIGSETVDVPGTGRSSRVVTLTPKAPNGRALFWIHGGGMIMGLPEMDLVLYNFLAEAGVTVVAPSYSLGPEVPHPAAIEDIEAVWAWWSSSSAKLGITTTVLGGSSAGSTLAEQLALRLAARSALRPALTILDSPFLSPEVENDACASAPSAKFHVWTIKNVSDSSVHYPVSDLSSLFPLHASDANISKLGPHLVSYPDIDIFTDGSIRYVEKLKLLGVKVSSKVWPGRIHAFMTLGAAGPSAAEARQFYLDAILAAWHVDGFSTKV